MSRIAWMLLAYGLLTGSLFVSDGHDQPAGAALLLLGSGALGVALFSSRARPGQDLRPPVEMAFVIAIASTLCSFVRTPGAFVQKPLAMHHALAAAAVLIVASYAPEVWRGKPSFRSAPRVRPYAMLALALALGAWMVQASPSPRIDVWQVHQQGARALASGHSPYAPGAIDTRGTWLESQTVRAYGYPPASLVLTTVAYCLTGDTRWAVVVAIVAGGLLLWLVARRCTQGPWADLVLACYLFHPRGLFVIEEAWGDPLALPFLGGFALTAMTKRFRLAAALLGLLCSVKQHFALYLPVLAFVPGIGLQGLVVALATVAVTYAPFAIATPAGIWHGLVGFHTAGLFRPDSLSITALLADAGLFLPSWVGFAAMLVLLGCAVRARRSLGDRLLWSAAVFQAFYLFGRQAFCNYYYLVGATLLFGAAIGEG